MIRFLFKGLIRDTGRSRLPVLVVAIGVMLSVLMHAYINGIMGDTIEMNAKFNTGHVKIMTSAYYENIKQSPNDLALLGTKELLGKIKEEYPGLNWTSRIKFGGLVDIPDENGETKTQGPAAGMGLDLLSPGSKESERLNLSESLVRGSLIKNPGEVLISEEFSKKLDVSPGDPLTLIGSTMNGSMSMYNFTIAGTVRFGSSALDRGIIIADISDIRIALNMEDAAGEILGYFENGYYKQEKADAMVQSFNNKYYDESDEFSPKMITLRAQDNMATYVDMSSSLSMIITMIFMFAMSLVLWNAGLLGGLRRYGEIGVRLAIGEEKNHVYMTMILEAIMIGIIGSILGTIFGLFFAWLIQTYGIDISSAMQGSSVMMPGRIRAHITPVDFYIGFIPGLIATVIGTALAGIGIFKRNTAQLFKELEV